MVVILVMLLLVNVALWLQVQAIVPTRMEYANLEQEISKVYGSSAKAPPFTYVLVTNFITLTKIENIAVDELILYGDIQLKWHDESIAWDPRSFKNITYTLLHPTTIWYPRPQFLNIRYTTNDQLIEVDYKGKCQCRIHFSITIMRTFAQRILLQIQVGEDEASVILSPTQLKVVEPSALEGNAIKIAFVDQWHDKRLSNVLNILLNLSQQCRRDVKRTLMKFSRFVAQMSTFLVKPQNVHRITIALLSTLLALKEHSFVDCIRPSGSSSDSAGQGQKKLIYVMHDNQFHKCLTFDDINDDDLVHNG
ncbi:unnamed protein product [Anisakis simplex]|uniref:Neur_chan_LBD domain-containing protein n=1 Tax=Anisakis simplex TaxID=6269 RepID=A0A158PNK6_ANISI|nr:unnamed protein product [Anisakis simplex]